MSDRVWRIGKQARAEIEIAIDHAIGPGVPAERLTRTVRQYHNEPKKLFRRVRNKNGELVESKRMREYNPGRGVYKSSYKNAKRLTRTENNMAYRTADFERWNQLDFVVGIEIKLSNNPNICDTCKQLAGKYPKGFRFVGWHPQCRCYVIPILMKPHEFDQYIEAVNNDEDVSSFRPSNEVKEVPKGFLTWIKDNKAGIGSLCPTLSWIISKVGISNEGCNSMPKSRRYHNALFSIQKQYQPPWPRIYGTGFNGRVK